MKLLSLRSYVLAAVAAVIIGFTGNALAGAPTGLRFQLTPKLSAFSWYFYYSSNGVYEILVYTQSGWYVAQEDETIEYLVVGGGGEGDCIGGELVVCR